MQSSPLSTTPVPIRDGSCCRRNCCASAQRLEPPAQYRVLLGEVVDLDPLAKRVRLADGASFDYDALIVAAGSQTSYYGMTPGGMGPGLKSVEEATNSGTKFCTPSKWPSGCGSRAAAGLAYVRHRRRRRHRCRARRSHRRIARQTLSTIFARYAPRRQISFRDGAPRVLMPFPEDLARRRHARWRSSACR